MTGKILVLVLRVLLESALHQILVLHWFCVFCWSLHCIRYSLRISLQRASLSYSAESMFNMALLMILYDAVMHRFRIKSGY